MLQAPQGAVRRLAGRSQTHRNTPHNNRKQDQTQVLTSFLLASPSIEFRSVQGDVGIGVELPLLLHVTFTFLWETVIWEKMQHEARCM